MEQVCNGILRAIVSMSGSDCGFYGLVDEERSAMTVYTWPIKGKKKDGSAACPRRFSVSAEGIWGAAIQHREPVVLNDAGPFQPWTWNCLKIRAFAPTPCRTSLYT
jgi:hypothetical protein